MWDLEMRCDLKLIASVLGIETIHHVGGILFPVLRDGEVNNGGCSTFGKAGACSKG
jgi:hypothetical protein